ETRVLESPDAGPRLPERLKLHQIIYRVWQGNGPFVRACRLQVIARVKLTYGPWRALKRIFKEAEGRGDTEVYGALAARFDAAYAGAPHSMRIGTLAYLVRRAWRYLRRIGVSLPACYADTAADFLASYTDQTTWQRTWIANHVFFHQTKQYNRGRFTYRGRQTNLLQHRAFPELWMRTPRPLFALLERARSEQVRDFATS